MCEEQQQTQQFVTQHWLQDALKARQKDVKAAEAASTAAIEEREKAEAKLAAAKAEHEKAVTRAKATGLIPAISGLSQDDPEKAEKRWARRSTIGWAHLTSLLVPHLALQPSGSSMMIPLEPKVAWPAAAT